MKSVIFHVCVIILASIGFLFKDDIIEIKETPIEVSFVQEKDEPIKKPVKKTPEPVKDLPPPIEEKPEAAQKALEQPKERKPDIEIADKTEYKIPEPKAEKPEPKSDPEPQKNIVPDPVMAQVPLEKNRRKPEPPKKVAENKPVQEQKQEKPAKKDTQADFMSVLKNLQESEPRDTQRDGPKLTESPTIDRMTTGELDAFRRQLSRCWSILPGAVQANSLAVNLTINVNRDRTVRDVQITDRARYNTDNYFRAAADNAVRAIKHPDCTPLDLPVDKYTTWNTITLNFDPRTMF